MEKVAYIHANPVRAGLATKPEDYLWSSAINYALAANNGVAEGNAFGYPGYPRHPVSITPYTEVL